MGNGTLATDYTVSKSGFNSNSLIGVGDSSKGMVSLWFNPSPALGSELIYARSFATGFDGITYLSASNSIRIALREAGTGPPAFVVFFTSMVGVLSGIVKGSWNHILISWDYTGPSLLRHMYINDQEQIGVIGANKVGLVAHTSTIINHFVGGFLIPPPTNQVTQEYTGCLSEFYWNPTEFRDFSFAPNRRKFIDAAGNPVELGPNASVPTGTAPAIYFPDGGDAVNAGNGGAFVPFGPAVTACATVPSPALDARTIIEQVRDEIDAAGIAETDKFLILRLGFSESFLTDALSKFDAGDFRKVAKGVRKAVKFLELAVEKGFDAATATDWADRLCGAIRQIASDEIDAAIARNPGDIEEVFRTTVVADVAGSLNNTFFTFSSGARDYYVWISVDGLGTDPLIAGKTGIPVGSFPNPTVVSGSAALLVNFRVANAMNVQAIATSDFKPVVSGLEFFDTTILSFGNVTDAADGAAPTGFTLATTTQGAIADPLAAAKVTEAQEAFADGDLEKFFMEFLAAINDYEKAIKSATVA